jgi:hypothetical protein
MTLASQRFTAVLLLTYGSLFLSDSQQQADLKKTLQKFVKLHMKIVG